MCAVCCRRGASTSYSLEVTQGPSLPGAFGVDCKSGGISEIAMFQRRHRLRRHCKLKQVIQTEGTRAQDRWGAGSASASVFR